MLDKTEVKRIKKTIKDEDVFMADVFDVLGDKNRFRIIKILIKHGELCVSDLAAILGISISSISQHLRILEMKDLVAGERMGQMMCYRVVLDNPKVEVIIKTIKKL